jgi:signal transduction histidine kinase
MDDPGGRRAAAAHELKNAISAVLLGVHGLRRLAGGPDRERALAALDRIESAAARMEGLLEELRPAGAGEDGS